MSVLIKRAQRHGRTSRGPPKNGQFIFWAIAKIWAEGVLGVSNIALIHTKRAHANFVLENETERVIDIFGSRTGRELFILV